MMMFSHPFAPFFHVQDKDGAPKPTPTKKTTAAGPARGRAISVRPVTLDVEKAVAIMLVANDVESDEMRQHFRLHLIKNLPSASIDWGTIDWVQGLPFKTIRL
jgi:hypothetical protein